MKPPPRKAALSRSDPRLIEGERLLRSGMAEAAVPWLRTAADAAGLVGAAHALLLEALLLSGRRQEAGDRLRAALALPVESADAYDALAFYARQLDEHELSNQLYRKAAELAPDDGQFWLNLATSERSLGRLDTAAIACQRAIDLDPELSEAIFLRSEVSRATITENHVAELADRLAKVGDDRRSIFLLYALGKELHELGRHEEAFDMFHRGATARRATLSYDVAQDEAKMARIAEVFATSSPRPAQPLADRHIFIIGLPRSGTTLTERILGGLPNVRSNNETDNFSTALLKASPPHGPDVFARAAQADFRLVAREYEARAAFDGFAGAIIEKLPFNYLYVGPILTALPAAPIVWVRRHPLDSCFAMYRTLFGAAYPFSYAFEDLARYYAAYERLMRHWQALYGDRIIAVDYEDLVSSPQRVGQALATRCGLEWSSHALDLASNRSASLTASASQVRGEIYATSSGLWRQYAPHLAPLAEQLRRLGVEVPV